MTLQTTLVRYRSSGTRPTAVKILKRVRLRLNKRLVCARVKAGVSDDDLTLLAGKASLMRTELEDKERLYTANWATGLFSSGAIHLEDWVRLVRVSGASYLRCGTK